MVRRTGERGDQTRRCTANAASRNRDAQARNRARCVGGDPFDRSGKATHRLRQLQLQSLQPALEAGEVSLNLESTAELNTQSLEKAVAVKQAAVADVDRHQTGFQKNARSSRPWSCLDTLQGADKRQGFVFRLLELGIRIGVGHNATTGVINEAFAGHRGSTNRHRQLNVATEIDPANRPHRRTTATLFFARAATLMASIFGAPVIDPGGNVARSSSTGPTSARSRPCTTDSVCNSVGNRSRRA